MKREARIEFFRKREEYKKSREQSEVKLHHLEMRAEHWFDEGERILWNLDYSEEIIHELSEEFRTHTTLNTQDMSLQRRHSNVFDNIFFLMKSSAWQIQKAISW